MLKIRRPLGRLIFNMGIAIPGKTVFLIETAPWVQYIDSNDKYFCSFTEHMLLHNIYSNTMMCRKLTQAILFLTNVFFFCIILLWIFFYRILSQLYGPWLAVEGSYPGSVPGVVCSLTADNEGVFSWWAIDLEHRIAVSRIKVFPNDDCGM